MKTNVKFHSKKNLVPRGFPLEIGRGGFTAYIFTTKFGHPCYVQLTRSVKLDPIAGSCLKFIDVARYWFELITIRVQAFG